MDMRILCAVSGLLPVVLAATLIQADVTITMTGSPGATNSVIQVKGHMARMSQSDQPDYMVYDKSRDLLVQVNTGRREYMEIDRDTLKAFSNNAAEIKQQMEAMREQLRALPQGQGIPFEKQMDGTDIDLAAFEIHQPYDALVVSRGLNHVAGFDCQLYEVINGGERLGEVCMATATDTGLSLEDFSTMTAMTEFMRDVASSEQRLGGGLVSTAQVIMGEIMGVPVSVKDFQGGHDYSIAGVSDETLDEALFTDYKSYRKQPLPPLQ